MQPMSEPNRDSLEQAIRSLKSLQVDLTDAARADLARRCASEIALARRSLWTRMRETLVYPFPQRSFAAALATLFLLVVTGVLVSQRPTPQGPEARGAATIQLVSLGSDAHGRVTLEWRDGSQRVYTVLRSNNPRDFSRAAVFSVRGNRWTDPNPDPGQVTYYRVE